MKKIICFLLISYIFNVHAQVDTLVSYHCDTRQIEIISQLPSLPLHDFEHTNWSVGLQKNIALLDTNPPLKTMLNSRFSELVKADSILNILDFPICAVVKLFRYAGDTIQTSFTGIMVAPNIVLTCAHGIINFNTEIFYDSVLVIAGYDEYNDNSELEKSISKKYYITKNLYNFSRLEDIALIELQEPIGNITGWIGIAFHENNEFIQNRVLHKLSYPREDPDDENRFDGESFQIQHLNIIYEIQVL